MYAAEDTLHAGGAAVAIKLELCYTLADARAPVTAVRAQRIKAAMRAARLRREWVAYEALGAVAEPRAHAAARRYGIPLVHALGEQRAAIMLRGLHGIGRVHTTACSARRYSHAAPHR